MPLPNYKVFSEKLTQLKSLAKDLPNTVPVAMKKDRIYEVFQNIPVPDNVMEHWETFNRRMDSLFGYEIRDDAGRLLHVKRGPLGMDLVIEYIEEAAKSGSLDWDLAAIKVDRLITEFKALIELASTVTPNPSGSKTTKKPQKSKPVTVEDVTDDEDSRPARKLPKSKRAVIENESDDEDFLPPKRPRNEPQSPGRVLDTDGEEDLDETEQGTALKEKRVAKKAKSNLKSKGASTTTNTKGKKKAATVKGSKSNKGTSSQPYNISSGDESDGRTALRAIEAGSKAQQARRGPANKSMQHFHDPVPVVDRHGEKRWEFTCKYCSKIRSFARTIEWNSITFDDEPNLPQLNNLATHVNDCKKKSSANAPENDAPPTSEQLNLQKSADMMREFLKNGELNPSITATQKGFYRLFAAWILDESLPWTTGEAPSLRVLFQYLKVHFTLPTDTTVRNYLAHIFGELHEKVVREFTNVKSKIAYATDTWTTKQMVFTFACTIGLFVDDDWNLIQRVVDFKPLEGKEHEGIFAGLAFVNGARARGGLDKISLIKSHIPTSCLPVLLDIHFISLTSDNASVNDVLVQTAARCLLARYGIPYSPDMHIRCIAHVINLVVQAFLHRIDEADDPAISDWYELHKDAPIHYNVDDDEDQTELDQEDLDWVEDSMDMDNVDDEEDEVLAETVAGESPVQRVSALCAQLQGADKVTSPDSFIKLRFITTKIVSSPQRRLAFKQISQKKYGGNSKTKPLTMLMVVRDVWTRWNYTHAMIRRALMLRESIDTWVFENQSLRGVMLTSPDWILLEQIADFLEVFTRATLEVSHASKPTISYVLPIYENLHTHIVSATKKNNIHIRIRQGAHSALEKLIKYKEKATGNQYYTLGTVLHPSLRAEWFKKTTPPTDAKAQQDAVERAEVLFRHVAATYRENQPKAAPPSQTPATDPTPSTSASDGWFASLLDFEMAVDVPSSTMTPDEMFEDKLRRYLRFEGGRGDPANPLGWWRVHGAAFPTIARMARDFLAIPATSVSVERTFSKSCHICTDLRSSLKAKTVSEALLSKTWIRDGLFDVNKPVKPKKKHGEL